MKMLNRLVLPLVLMALVPGWAHAADDSDIVVMTQNQYLGADIIPLIGSADPVALNAAIINALATIAANDFPSRAEDMADSIAREQPHLVALQEVFDFTCTDFGSGACALFAPAFENQMTLTLDALEALGADYEVAAVVDNLILANLPVFLDPDAVPDLLVSVTDRDAILRRADVPTNPVGFLCAQAPGSGCNYQARVPVHTNLFDFDIPRGFVAVDAVVGGDLYRFVNTHLEIAYPAPDPQAPFFQAAQATELLATLALFPMAPTTRLIVAGDFNSSPEQVGPFVTPYQQFTTGLDFTGTQAVSFPYTDVWNLRHGSPLSLTCCQHEDLSNRESDHSERIDLIFAYPQPTKVRADVIDKKRKKKDEIWPSDHSGVVAGLRY